MVSAFFLSRDASAAASSSAEVVRSVTFAASLNGKRQLGSAMPHVQQPYRAHANIETYLQGALH